MRIAIFTRCDGGAVKPGGEAEWQALEHRGDWSKQRSRSTGAVYYSNKQTQQSFYTEKDLVDWWGFERSAAGGGAKTYVHVLNGERTAVRPTAAPVPDVKPDE